MNTKLKINKLNKKSLSEKSKQWLKSHMNDPFVRQAQKDGYICRAAYKLIEIQQKFKLINKHHNVIELGSSPGGWSQVLTQILHTGKIFAIDLLPMKFVHHKIHFIQGDFITDYGKILEKIDFYNNNDLNHNHEIGQNDKIGNGIEIDSTKFSSDEIAFQNRVKSLKELLLGGNNSININDEDGKVSKNEEESKNSHEPLLINGILSDMAPNCSGDSKVDHWRIMDLCEDALTFSDKILCKGGYLILKIFFGGDEKIFLQKLKKHFKNVQFFKPDSSKKESAEMYIVATSFLKKN